MQCKDACSLLIGNQMAVFFHFFCWRAIFVRELPLAQCFLAAFFFIYFNFSISLLTRVNLLLFLFG